MRQTQKRADNVKNGASISIVFFRGNFRHWTYVSYIVIIKGNVYILLPTWTTSIFNSYSSKQVLRIVTASFSVSVHFFMLFLIVYYFHLHSYIKSCCVPLCICHHAIHKLVNIHYMYICFPGPWSLGEKWENELPSTDNTEVWWIQFRNNRKIICGLFSSV